MGKYPTDPVQLYLTQMSSTPLLARCDELEAARQIDRGRKNFRHAILSSDYLLGAVAAMLRKAALERIRVEVVCDVPFTSQPDKRRLMRLVGPNLQTMRDLLRRNRVDFAAYASKGKSRAERREIRRRLNPAPR